MSTVSLKCTCGSVTGIAKNVTPKSGNRVICYCDDCQAFTHYLDQAKVVLDGHGGTDIFQMPPASVEINTGIEQVRCVRLTEKGIHRWYAACCNTPIGNTMGAGFPFVGIIHKFMDSDIDRDLVLGPVRARVQAQHATDSLPPGQGKEGFPLGVTLNIMSKILRWKITGKGKPNPFFDENGLPVSKPNIVASKSQ